MLMNELFLYDDVGLSVLRCGAYILGTHFLGGALLLAFYTPGKEVCAFFWWGWGYLIHFLSDQALSGRYVLNRLTFCNQTLYGSASS